MRKYLMYVVTLVLSVAVAACGTQYQPTEVPRPSALAADALQRGKAAYDRQDYMTALREWLPLAQQGYAPAQNNLGFLYEKGQGVAQDYALALHWYLHAAVQGYAMAQNNLGFLYTQGRGVAQDYAQALHWLKQAVAQGNALAQVNLGVMYAEGRGVAQDDAEAVRLYRQAAQQGAAQAHHNLGAMYEQGRGMTRDLVEAQRWYAKAAELFPPGPKRIAAIEARDRVARQLTANQVPVSQPAAVTPPTPISASPPAPAPRPALSNGEEISLVKAGGVYELPVEINGRLTLNFVLDSGATEMNIPVDVVSTLIRTGTITNTDFLPEKMYILADGSQQSSPRFVIRSVKIGHQSIPNVSASIGNINSGLLIGQSLLEKLGTWGVDTQRQVLIVRPR